METETNNFYGSATITSEDFLKLSIVAEIFPKQGFMPIKMRSAQERPIEVRELAPDFLAARLNEMLDEYFEMAAVAFSPEMIEAWHRDRPAIFNDALSFTESQAHVILDISEGEAATL